MKNAGLLLTGIWLIVFGLKQAIALNFDYDDLILGVLGIVAGVFLVLRR